MFLFGERTLLGDLPPLALYAEHLLANWYSSMLMAVAATLLAAFGCVEKNSRLARYWLSLAAVFVFLSIDEAIALHERLISPLQDAFGFTGLVWNAWVVPYGIFCLILGFIYLPFLLELPPKLRRPVVIAGALYIGAALGLEALQGYWYVVNTSISRKLADLSALVEESGEIVALTIFVVALVKHLERSHASISFAPRRDRDIIATNQERSGWPGARRQQETSTPDHFQIKGPAQQRWTSPGAL